MSTIDTDRFRQQLQTERTRVANAIEYLHSENPGTIEDETGEESYDNHLADIATVTSDRAIDYTLEDNAENLLAAIDRALERIEDGTYGTCVNCGQAIAEERLEAMPWAELCIDCKRRAEQR
jgi:RNA polymerase-binding transcription factor